MAGVVRSDALEDTQDALHLDYDALARTVNVSAYRAQIALGRHLTDAHVQEALALPVMKTLTRAHEIAFNLESYSKITDEAVQGLANAFPQMTRLNLKSCVAITDHAIEHVARVCPGLKEIDLSWCNITQESLFHLARHCPDLEKVSVRSCYITDRSVAFLLGHCAHLSKLSLAWCKSLTDKTLKTIAAYQGPLRVFDMRGNERVSAKGLNALFKEKNTFEVVHLKRCTHVDDQVLEALSGSAHTLARLNLRGCDHGGKLTPRGLARLLEKTTMLESLDLAWHAYLDDGVLQTLGTHVKGLRKIDLSGCVNITSLGLNALFEGCPKLEKVILFDTPHVPESYFSPGASYAHLITHNGANT